MKTEFGALQLELISDAVLKEKPGHADLIGRRFFDGSSDVRVMSVSRGNPQQVIVERVQDGRTWTISAGIIRLIVGRSKEKRVA